MRKIAVLFFAVAAAMSATAQDAFKAAAMTVDITPDRPQWLQGYAPRKSDGVNDRIYHRIAAIDDGETEFYLVASDLCVLSPGFYDDMTETLEAETGVTREQIWWTCTHTHSAPHVGPQDMSKLFGGTLGDRFSIDHDTEYWQEVTRKLIDGVKEVRSKIEPARIGIAIGTARANVNRRELREGKVVLGVNPDGPVDRQLGLIRLDREDGSPIALIANYAIHGTALNGANTKITGDVTGWVSSYVEAELGVPLLFVNGAEGNVAPIHSVYPDIDDPRFEDFDHLLAEPIIELKKTITGTTSDVSLHFGETIIETPRKKGLGWPEALSDYASVSDDGVDHIRIPVRGMVISGDTVIWAAPLELFSEIAINVRDRSPFERTLYFGLTNGSLMYLCTAIAHEEGGYEPNVSPFTPQAEADFTNGVVTFIERLHAAVSANR